MDVKNKVFAYLLLDTVYTKLLLQRGVSFLTDAWAENYEDGEKLKDKLKIEGAFSEGERSLFSAYKTLRDKNIPGELGEHDKKVMRRFKVDMSKDEMFNTAMAIIQEWQGVKGIEKK